MPVGLSNAENRAIRSRTCHCTLTRVERTLISANAVFSAQLIMQRSSQLILQNLCRAAELGSEPCMRFFYRAKEPQTRVLQHHTLSLTLRLTLSALSGVDNQDMAVAVAESALQDLATIAPAEFVQRSDGTRSVRSLYQRLQKANLIAHEVASDVEALHAVFDVALNKGLGCLILDYIEEVCDSRTMVSSDPMDAMLLDGETVRQWCTAATQRSKTIVLEQLNNVSLVRIRSSSTTILQHELGCTRMLMLIFSALMQTSSPDRYRCQMPMKVWHRMRKSCSCFAGSPQKV